MSESVQDNPQGDIIYSKISSVLAKNIDGMLYRLKDIKFANFEDVISALTDGNSVCGLLHPVEAKVAITLCKQYTYRELVLAAILAAHYK